MRFARAPALASVHDWRMTTLETRNSAKRARMITPQRTTQRSYRKESRRSGRKTAGVVQAGG
jgi:hypothetical protein